MALSLGLHVGLLALQTADAAEDLGEVEGLDGDAVGFEQLLAVADGVEGRGTRADGADAELAQAVGDAADGGEPRDVADELRRVGRFGVQRSQRVGDAVLLEVIADAHLAAEGIAAVGDGHLAGVVGRRLDEHGDVQVRPCAGIRRSRARRRSSAG